MALGKTNLAVLAKAFGTKVTAWIGQTIEVYLDESVMFAGQFTGGLRVRVPKPPLRPAPPAAAAEFDESLPGRPLAARGLRAALVARYGDDGALLVERVEELSRLTGRNARVALAATELLLSYHSGKPKEEIELSANVNMKERLEAERELFSKLDIEQLEELAAESQALVDKAMAMVRANASPMLLGVSPSTAAGVDNVVTGEPTDQSAARTLTDQRDVGGADTAPPDTP